MNNAVIEKYNDKTIRIKGRIYKITIWGEPEDIRVQLEHDGTGGYDRVEASYGWEHLSSNVSEPEHIAACEKAKAIRQEVEDAATADFEEEDKA